MDFNATWLGQVILILGIIFTYLTIKFARGKSNNVPLVGFYAVLLNLLFPPGGWIYCVYWNLKK